MPRSVEGSGVEQIRIVAGDRARTHEQLRLLPVVTEVALERRAIDLHVVVEQPHERPLRLFDPRIACGGEPTVLLPDRLQLDGKGLTARGDELAGTVSRAVEHHHHVDRRLRRRVEGGGDRREQPVELVATLKRRDHDRHLLDHSLERSGHDTPPPSDLGS